MDNAFYGQINVFQTIVQEGSISAAARKLQIAVPSVSQSLKLLEQKIGVPLFHRTTRRIQLTDAGQQLFNETQHAMLALHHAIDNVKNFNDKPSGIVRITLARISYQLILRPFLAEFQTRYPQIQLEILINDGLSHLLDENIDLGIRFSHRLEEGMVARKLMKPMKEGLYISADYAEKYGIPTTPEELDKHKLIGYRFISSNQIEPLIINLNGLDTAFKMDTPIMCNDPDVLADATRQGVGIGRIFDMNMDTFEDKSQFIPILKPYWREYPPVYLYYLQHSQKVKKIQVVIEFLLEKMREKGYLE